MPDQLTLLDNNKDGDLDVEDGAQVEVERVIEVIEGANLGEKGEILHNQFLVARGSSLLEYLSPSAYVEHAAMDIQAHGWGTDELPGPTQEMLDEWARVAGTPP